MRIQISLLVNYCCYLACWLNGKALYYGYNHRSSSLLHVYKKRIFLINTVIYSPAIFINKQKNINKLRKKKIINQNNWNRISYNGFNCRRYRSSFRSINIRCSNKFLFNKPIILLRYTLYCFLHNKQDYLH